MARIPPGDRPKPRIVPEDVFVRTLSSPAAALPLSEEGATAQDLVATLHLQNEAEVNIVHHSLTDALGAQKSAEAQVEELKKAVDPARTESAIERGKLQARADMIEPLQIKNTELVQQLQAQEKEADEQSRKKEEEIQQLKKTISELNIIKNKNEGAVEQQQNELEQSEAAKAFSTAGADDSSNVKQGEKGLEELNRSLQIRLDDRLTAVEEFRKVRDEQREEIKRLTQQISLMDRENQTKTRQIDQLESTIKERTGEIENNANLIQQEVQKQKDLKQRIHNLEAANADLIEKSINSFSNSPKTAHHIKKLENELSQIKAELTDVKRNGERDRKDLDSTRIRLSEAKRLISTLEREKTVLKGKAALGENAHAKAEGAQMELSRLRKEMVGLQEDIEQLVEEKQELELWRADDLQFKDAFEKAKQELLGEKELYEQERRMHAEARGIIGQQSKHLAQLTKERDEAREVVQLQEEEATVPVGMDRKTLNLAAELEKHELQEEIDPIQLIKDEHRNFDFELARKPYDIYDYTNFDVPEGRRTNVVYITIQLVVESSANCEQAFQQFLEENGGVPEPEDESDVDSSEVHGLLATSPVAHGPSRENHSTDIYRGTVQDAWESPPGPFPGTVNSTRKKKTTHALSVDFLGPQITNSEESSFFVSFWCTWAPGVTAVAWFCLLLAFVTCTATSMACTEEKEKWLAANHTTYDMFIELKSGITAAAGIVGTTVLTYGWVKNWEPKV